MIFPWSADAGRSKSIHIDCGCKYRQPKCEIARCGQDAPYSVYLPWQPMKFKFMCTLHYAGFWTAMNKPIKGLDRPAYASDDWRPSIMEVARWGCMAVNEEDRRNAERNTLPPDVSPDFRPVLPRELRWTPQQRANAEAHRRGMQLIKTAEGR